jgi:hypothetical protein
VNKGNPVPFLTLPLFVAIVYVVACMVGRVTSPWVRRYSVLKRVIVLLTVAAVMLAMSALPALAADVEFGDCGKSVLVIDPDEKNKGGFSDNGGFNVTSEGCFRIN